MPAEPNPPNAPMDTSERARPVLGAQLAPPGTSPLRYVRDVEDPKPYMALVPSRPYYEEDLGEMPLAISQLRDLDTSIVQLPAHALYMLANGGYRAQGTYPKGSTNPGPSAPTGPCYECGGPHFAKD